MASGRREAGTDSPAAEGRRGVRAPARTIVAAVLAVLVILFAVLNSQDVEVDWVVTTTETPLVVVMALCAVAGLVIGRLLAWRRARQR
jgi:uncharacterized integral membrane protein